jgi:hypothetical protein
MSMKHPQRHHDKAAQKRRVKQQELKEAKRSRRKQLTEARTKQT